jgi:hypothetical protein
LAAREIFGRLGAGRDLDQAQKTMQSLPRPDVSGLLSSLGG